MPVLERSAPLTRLTCLWNRRALEVCLSRARRHGRFKGLHPRLLRKTRPGGSGGSAARASARNGGADELEADRSFLRGDRQDGARYAKLEDPALAIGSGYGPSSGFTEVRYIRPYGWLDRDSHGAPEILAVVEIVENEIELSNAGAGAGHRSCRRLGQHPHVVDERAGARAVGFEALSKGTVSACQTPRKSLAPRRMRSRFSIRRECNAWKVSFASMIRPRDRSVNL